MTTWQFGANSERHLVGVHPSLVSVMRRALELAPYDFGISQGVRTIEQQEGEVAAGNSTTMNSLHLVQSDGFSHAVDIAVYVPGLGLTWEHKYFRKVLQAIFTAAIELGVQIEAGALWRDFVDSPHIQLNSRMYN
jgi:peptidoglycan L-alanyl-D-glutamate endopeptidase CwlK